MNVFLIKIQRNTKKGNTENLKEIVVNTASDIDEITNFFINKYDGFRVVVDKVPTVSIELDEKNVSMGLKDIEVIEVKEEFGSFYGKYTVKIPNHKISNYEALVRPIRDKKNELEEEEIKFRKIITEKFKLSKIEKFKRYNDYVYFEYRDSWMNFTEDKLPNNPAPLVGDNK